MQAGKLRNRITILRKTEGTPNASGEPTITWESLGTFYAGVMALQGSEAFSVQQRNAEARHKIMMRFQPNIEFRRADGIVRDEWDGSSAPDLDILDVMDPDGRRRELVIYAREFTA